MSQRYDMTYKYQPDGPGMITRPDLLLDDLQHAVAEALASGAVSITITPHVPLPKLPDLSGLKVTIGEGLATEVLGRVLNSDDSGHVVIQLNETGRDFVRRLDRPSSFFQLGRKR